MAAKQMTCRHLTQDKTNNIASNLVGRKMVESKEVWTPFATQFRHGVQSWQSRCRQ